MEFDNFLNSLLDSVDMLDGSSIEGAMAIVIPRHSDATEAGILRVIPHEDADLVLVLGEILVSLIWHMLEAGYSKEEIGQTVGRAMYFWDQIELLDGSEENEEKN